VRVAVLGLGLIGGSVGIAARERAGAHVVGWDPDPEVGPVAREHGAVDEAAPTLVGALAGADVAFAAAPVDVLGEVVADALRVAGPDCVVSDVGSVKAPVVDAAYGDPRFVGGHPVAGAEAAGVAHARGDLFDGAVWYLTPTARTDGMLYQRLYKLVGAFGARPEAIDPAVHDRRMSVVSHLPHVLANLLVDLAARELEGGAPGIGGSFRDATRVAGANPRLWAGIYAANREALSDQLDAAITQLTRARDELRTGGDLREWQEAVARDRRTLLEERAVGVPQRELRVAVTNRPGVVAEIALALGREGINISDMSLSPSWDATQGTVTLWCAADHADRATTLIGELGFPVA
jgi:prephenate dehydrogenase